jgi:hypothetical protein
MIDLPKTPRDWVLAGVWGIFATAAGTQFVVSLTKGEWNTAIAVFALFLALMIIIMAVIFSEKLRELGIRHQPKLDNGRNRSALDHSSFVPIHRGEKVAIFILV